MLSGAIGVVSKEKEPSSASWANMRGFWQQRWSMFRVGSHCVVRRHQLAMGKTWGGRQCQQESDFSRCGLHVQPNLCNVCPMVFIVGESVASG